MASNTANPMEYYNSCVPGHTVTELKNKLAAIDDYEEAYRFFSGWIDYVKNVGHDYNTAISRVGLKLLKATKETFAADDPKMKIWEKVIDAYDIAFVPPAEGQEEYTCISVNTQALPENAIQTLIPKAA